MQAPDKDRFTRGRGDSPGPACWIDAMIIRTVFTTAVVLAACHGHVWADERFESVKAYLEQTAEDEDSEATFEAVGGTSGLTALKVVAPDGRTVIDFKAAGLQAGDAAPHPGDRPSQSRMTANFRQISRPGHTGSPAPILQAQRFRARLRSAIGFLLSRASSTRGLTKGTCRSLACR